MCDASRRCVLRGAELRARDRWNAARQEWLRENGFAGMRIDPMPANVRRLASMSSQPLRKGSS